MKRLYLLIALLIIGGIFLFGGYALSEEKKPEVDIEVTQSSEASVSSPVKPEEAQSKKSSELNLILSGSLPLFWTVSL